MFITDDKTKSSNVLKTQRYKDVKSILSPQRMTKQSRFQQQLLLVRLYIEPETPETPETVTSQSHDIIHRQKQTSGSLKSEQRGKVKTTSVKMTLVKVKVSHMN